MYGEIRVSAIALIGLLSTVLAGHSRASETPNVVYILADDLGYGDLSCYGQEKFSTPNIDRLAVEGMQFTNHYSGNTVCSPSRAVLMTGLHSGHCYLRGNLSGEVGAELDPEMVVLPELFQAAGYETGCFGKWGLGHTYVDGPANPLNHGFNHFFGWKSQTIAHTYFPRTLVSDGDIVPVESGTYVHDLVMDAARDFIRDNAKAAKPFFCYIPTAVPHAAMHAPAELHKKWRERLPEFDRKIGKYGAADEPCPDVINPIAGFAAMMENLDNEIGETLALIESLGIDENTVIMFASDNGAHKEGGHDPAYWNSTGDLRGHKRDMHEGGIRTPMLVRWPGIVQASSTSNHLSGFQDILPTMADLVGQPCPPGRDGISFAPTLRGDSAAQQQHEYLYFEFCTGTAQKIASQAVRKGDWKGFRQKGKKLEIYDLAADPTESNDLAASKSDIATEITAIMEAAHTPLPTAEK